MFAPDLKAPRFRYRTNSIVNKPFFKRFKDKYPQYSKYPDALLEKIIYTHNKSIAHEVADTRDGIELQSGIGYLFVGMAPARKERPAVAWKQSHALGMKVYYKNHETDGKVFKVYYSNYSSTYKIKNRDLWYFTTERDFRTSIPVICKPKWKQYVVSENSLRIRDIINANHAKTTAIKNHNKNLPTYDDLEID